MAILETYLLSNKAAAASGLVVFHRYFIADTEGERPSSGLLEGDIAYTKDTDKLWIADSATTWKAAIGGGGALYTATATGTVSNNAAETTIVGSGVGSLTLAANSIKVGRTYRIIAKGIYSTQAVPVTLNIRLKLGSVVLAATGDQTPTGALTNRYWHLEGIFTCRTTGATGTVFAQSEFYHNVSASITLNNWEMTNTATTTIDTTAAQAVDLTADWGAGVAAADSISCTNFILESLN